MILMIERNQYGVIWSRMWRGSNCNGERPNNQTGSPANYSGNTIMEIAIHHKLRLFQLPHELDLPLRRDMVKREIARLEMIERAAEKERDDKARRAALELSAP